MVDLGRTWDRGRLTEGLISRGLPVDDGSLNVLVIEESEVCEATDE